MRVGTKSVLYGAHCFFIHPGFVALAWWKLYGFPWDPRLWVAFFVHDLGYFGKPNMDGPEGEEHVEAGARFMHMVFGPKWYWFTLLHSRFYAAKCGMPFSRLCVADKLATAITPRWLYLVLVNLTGEIDEYMGRAGKGKYQRDSSKMASASLREDFSQKTWHWIMTDFMRKWAWENRDRAERVEKEGVVG